MSIPQDAFPHLFDAIVKFAPYHSLLALRTASRATRDRVDAALVSHVAIIPPAFAPPVSSWDLRRSQLSPGPPCMPWSPFKVHDYLCAVYDGEHRATPRKGWYRCPSLCDSVRIMDVHSPVGSIMEEWQGWYNDCWCLEQDHGGLPDSPALLASCFTKLRLVRSWGQRSYTLTRHFVAPRQVAFLEPERRTRDPFIMDIESTSCTVVTVHLGCQGSDTDVTFPYNRWWHAGAKDEPLRVFVRFTSFEGQPSGSHEASQKAEDFGISVYNILLNRGKVTLVEPRTWSCLREVIDKGVIEHGGDTWASLKSFWSPLWNQMVEVEDEPDEVRRMHNAIKTDVTVISEEEYRASVGEEVYALEEFSFPK
jgi:hypothetical protein